ncbi:hypothetical protein MLPF_2498 [Mycobacterium lepromatosis]|nr:hypothetical protein MLPF_2498 [Mycobacterium lepromatosis]
MCLLALMLTMFPFNIYAVLMPHLLNSMVTWLLLRTATEVIYLGGGAILVDVDSS